MCGVAGVFNIPNASSIIAQVLHAQQNRGADSAGISTHETEAFHLFRESGRISSTLSNEACADLKGNIGVGHVRYATAPNSKGDENIQPIAFEREGIWTAMAHNGNFHNFKEIKKSHLAGESFNSAADTEPFLKLVIKKKGVEFTVENIMEALHLMRGSCSGVISLPDRIITIRDSSGNRPLFWGKKGNGYVVASEPCGLDAVDVFAYKEVQPGTIMTFTKEGLATYQLPISKLWQCSFELVYFAFPLCEIFGVNVRDFRISLGKAAAKQFNMDADVIIGVPDSATEMAEGFSTEVSGNSSDKLIYRRHDVRSFIKNSKAEIQKALNLKFSFSTKEIRGQRVIVIDDSIVRGHTSKKIVQALKDRGAKEVHFISGSPKITGGCKYGINLENEDLIATDRNDDEICAEIGADSVTYLSMESFKEVFRKHGVDPNDFCFACMDGNYW